MKLVLYGDSIVYGQLVSVESTWAVRLATRLAVHGVETQVAAICGETTRQALERFARDYQKHGGDILYLQFGLNDANVWETDRGVPRVYTDEYAANLNALVRRGRHFGARSVILGTNHFCNLGNGFNERLCDYNAVVVDMAARNGCDLVDHSGWTGLLPDGVHISAVGHDEYLHRMYAACELIVRSL